MYVLSTPFAWTTPNTLQLRCRFGFAMFDEKGLGQAEQHYTLYIWSAVCTQLCIQLPFWQSTVYNKLVDCDISLNLPSSFQLSA